MSLFTEKLKACILLAAALLFCLTAVSFSQTVDIRVATGEDDYEEVVADGLMDTGSSDLEVVFDKTKDQLIGIRFLNVAIPQGATITNAYVQFECDEVGSKNIDPCSVNIQGDANDNAPAFTTTAKDISNRTRTTAIVIWTPPTWVAEHDKGVDQRTPDIKSVIQEIVSRGGWASGNSLVIIMTGTGSRCAEAYEGEAEGAPLLHVEYTTGTDVEDKNVGVPSEFSLGNYPNPFNPSTKVYYSVPTTGMVRMSVFDMNGREVATLVNEVKTAGSYEYVWNPSNPDKTFLPSGTYLCRLEAGSNVKTIRMLYVK